MKDSKNLFKLTPIWEDVVTGTKFTGTIREQYCEGRIYVKPDGPGNVFYLCQNLQDGAIAPHTLGYRYSYTLGFGTEEELAENEVVFFDVCGAGHAAQPRLVDLQPAGPDRSLGAQGHGRNPQVHPLEAVSRARTASVAH